jgi:hypothetical protein
MRERKGNSARSPPNYESRLKEIFTWRGSVIGGTGKGCVCVRV